MALTPIGGFFSAAAVGPTTYLLDNFVDTDNTALQSHTMNTGPGWTIALGTWIIHPSGNAVQTAAGAQQAIAYTDCGHSDYTATLKFTVPLTGAFDSALLFRYTFGVGQWQCKADVGPPGTLFLQRGQTVISSVGATFNASTQYTLQAVVLGTSIQISASGQTLSTTDSSQQSATGIAMQSYQPLDQSTFQQIQVTA